MAERARQHRLLWLVTIALRHGVLPLLIPNSRRPARPARLRRALESLGGAWIKLGQLLALRFDLLPEAYCLELFGLLNDVTPLEPGEAEAIVHAELGRDTFASFDPKPFGSASIGQVHGAVLHDGRRVAVKVQRPAVERLIRSDIALMYRLSWLIDRTHALGGTGSRAVIDELARWMNEELDYRIEAGHAIDLRAKARDPETEYEPEIHVQLTSRRVLTAERLDGVLLLDVVRELRADREGCTQRLKASGHDLERIAGNIVWNFLGQAYGNGLFHGDLHPANLLVLEDDRIGYVDFGIVGRLPQGLFESLAGYAMNLFGGNAAEAVDELMRWLAPSRSTDTAAARDELIALTQRFLHDLEHRAAERRQVLAQFQVQLLSATRRHRMTIDPAVILYMKVVLTIDAVTSELAPELDLQALHERFFSELIVEGIERRGR